MEGKDNILFYQAGSGDTQIEVRLEDENVWLTQSQMQELFQATKQNISLHINNIFNEKELDREATVKDSLTVQKEGGRSVKRRVEYYSLDVIISVGYRVKSQRGTQFRIWANKILRNYLTKGYAIDKKRFQEQSRQLEELKQTVKLLGNVIES
ncbi:MAG TPA: RhuM family protein, partial [Puia sp.]|nr:RhuM family protein [Puia sp.]